MPLPVDHERDVLRIAEDVASLEIRRALAPLLRDLNHALRRLDERDTELARQASAALRQLSDRVEAQVVSLDDTTLTEVRIVHRDHRGDIDRIDVRRPDED